MSDLKAPAPGQPYVFPEVITPYQPPTPENTFTAGRAAVAAPGATKAPTPLPASLRQSYADALASGQTLGPGDFHDAYHAAGHEPIPDLAPQLPDQQSLIDTAISALRGNSIPPDPAAVSVVKQNLMDHWTATGQPPAQAIQDPEVRDQVARVPNTSPPLAATIQRLETGGLADPDAAVSRTGAIGRNQIEPSTARKYGFDPGQLHDAGYNNMVRDTILTDLSNRYHGENAAVLIAYNAGPGVADKWLASGRDNSVLPDETRKYLTNAARGGQDMTAPSPGKFDPGISFSERVQTAAASFADKFDDWAKEHVGEYGTLGDALKREPQEEKETAEETAINFTPLGVGSLAGEGLRAMFSTTEELAQAAENQGAREFARATIRGATGSARRFIAASSEALEGFRAGVNKFLPNYSDWLSKSPGVAIPMWGPDTPAVARLIDHIEGGHGGGLLPEDHPLRPVADALAELYQSTRAKLEADPNFDGMGFIEDYYRHSWLDTAKADHVMSGAGRTGSAASTQRRTIPTLMEGIAKGLTPRILDPIENTLHYISGMRNYMAAKQVFEAGRDAGFIKYGVQAPEAGWVPLKGRSATIAAGGMVQRAYAPAGYAQAYNSFVGQGVYSWAGPKGVKLYDNLQRMANLTTALKLSVSGYHYLVIAQESVTAGLANAIGEIAHGELVRGLKDLGLAATIAPHIAKAWRTGGRVTAAYLGHGGRELDQKIADIIEKAGGRVVGRGAEYAYAQASNWGKAFQRGSLAQELKVGLVHTLGLPEEPVARRAALALPRVGAFFGHELGRVMGTITAPLFDKIIPRLKTAALADEIATFLRQNPLADEQAILAHARRLTDSMDDRFGEMIQDNLFWNRTIKQALNLSTVSIGWEYGTLRGATGAVSDILHGDVLSPRARWLLAFPMTTGLFASVYQYIKTGLVGPSAQTPGRDMVAPRTGGTTPEGAPERVQIPGQQKDFLQWFRLMQDAPNVFELPHAIAAYATDKINPFGQVLTGTLTGSDWQGNPVYAGPPDPKTLELPGGFTSYAHFVMDALAPIGLGQPRLRGTNISTGERLMGIRPAPEWLQNPERVQNAEQREQRYQQREMLRRERRQKGRLENPPD